MLKISLQGLTIHIEQNFDISKWMGPRLPRITEKFGIHGFLVFLTFIVWGRYDTCLHVSWQCKRICKGNG